MFSLISWYIMATYLIEGVVPEWGAFDVLPFRIVEDYRNAVVHKNAAL